MLALRRKKGQTLVFAHPSFTKDITVSFDAIEHNGTRVKIGVDAPRSVRIVRGELLPWKEQPEQGETQPAPKIWYAADREKAHQSAGPRGRAYMEHLENVTRLSDQFWKAMAHKTMTPEQHELSEALLDALSTVGFLEKDEFEEEELPRDVIFH